MGTHSSVSGKQTGGTHIGGNRLSGNRQWKQTVETDSGKRSVENRQEGHRLWKQAVGSLKRYLSGHCWEVSRCYSGTSMEEVYQREEVLPLHIAELRSRIFQQIPWYLDAKVANSIIAGVHEAVLESKRRTRWRPASACT